jgi:hypothetical protein
MEADVIFHQFRHEAACGPTDGYDELHDIDALTFSFQRPFDGFDLASEPTNAIQELCLLPNGVAHAGASLKGSA